MIDGRGRRPPAWLPDLALLAATAVWGSTFVVVRDAIREIPPLTFIAFRFTLATAVLAPAVLIRHGPPDRATVRGGSAVGLWLGCGFALQTFGLLRTTPTRAAFLTGLSVVFVPLILVAVYRRRPRTASVVGVGLAAAGLALLTGVGRGGFGPGEALVLGCAAAFAMQVLAVDRYAREVGPLRLLLVEIAVVAAVAWVAALLVEPAPRIPGRSGLAAVAVTGLLATAAALWTQNWAQQRIPPTRAGVIFAMEPVFAAAYAYLTAGERLGPTGIAGSALIVAGMIAAEFRTGNATRPG